jgi:hypothetical protein
MLWSRHVLTPGELSHVVSARMPAVRRNLSGRPLPSEDDNEIAPLSIAKSFNLASNQPSFGIDLSALKTGAVSSGNKKFELELPPAAGLQPVFLAAGSANGAAAAIAIKEDVNSILFLHASAKPASNDWVDRYVYNPEDTADLLGWYEVVYEDSLVLTVPLRYRVNLLEWNWDQAKNPGNYCYGADLVSCEKDGGNPITFFAFEWPNPRPGKAIKEVRLRVARQFRNTRSEVIAENGVLLAAVSVVKRKATPLTLPPTSQRSQDDLPSSR